MRKLLTQAEVNELKEGQVISVRWIGSPKDVVCTVSVDTHGRRGANPAVLRRRDWSPLTNWLNDCGDGPAKTNVSLGVSDNVDTRKPQARDHP